MLVNFRSRYSLRRNVRLQINEVPSSIRSGKWQEWIVDGTHANVWNDQGKAELAKSRTGDLNGSSFILEATLMPNSVTSVELLKP